MIEEKIIGLQMRGKYFEDIIEEIMEQQNLSKLLKQANMEFNNLKSEPRKKRKKYFRK